MKSSPLLPALVLAGLLSACGGGASVGGFDGDDEFFFQPPFSSGRAASVTVSASTDATFNGTYAAADARVSPVTGLLASGPGPDTCRFRFEGLQQQATGSDRVMNGEIRYAPGTQVVRTTFVVINSIEFRLDGGPARLDRTANAVVYDNAVLTNTQGFAQTLRLSGSIPLRSETPPAGC